MCMSSRETLNDSGSVMHFQLVQSKAWFVHFLLLNWVPVTGYAHLVKLSPEEE